MRSFKALWRLAVNRQGERPATRPGGSASSQGHEPPSRDNHDKTAALLNQDPPTRTLQ